LPISPILIQKILDGDEDAFKQLYYKFYQPLTKFAYYYIKDPDRAEDIVQDVFVRVWINRKKLDPQKNIKTYLYKITTNFALMALRKRKVKEKYAKEQTSTLIDSPELEYIRNELDDLKNDAIFSLPQKCRNIFCMSRIDKLSYREIATALNLSIKTVEAQMGKALFILRKRLAKHLMNIL
jgi:RNA polymerase sigma-70 factor (ECF subfamily)